MWGDPDLDAVRQGHRVHDCPLMRRGVHVGTAGLALAALFCAGTNIPTDPPDSPPEPGRLTFVAVAAGDDHSSALTADGVNGGNVSIRYVVTLTARGHARHTAWLALR